MRRDTVNYVVVGLVVLATLGALGMVLLKITGRSGSVEVYYSQYHDASGLGFGTPVYYQGYRVGQIEEVVPLRAENRTAFRTEISVIEGWVIPHGSVAAIATSGLLADVFINIEEGPGPDAHQPGDQLPGRESTDLFAAVGGLASDASALVSDKLVPMMDTLNQRMDSISGQISEATPVLLDQVSTALDRIDKGAAGLESLFDETNLDQASFFIQNMGDASNEVKLLAQSLQQTQANLDKLLVGLNDLVAENESDLSDTVAEMRIMVEQLSDRMRTIGDNLDSASRNVNEFSRLISRDPSRLIYTAPDDRTGNRK